MAEAAWPKAPLPWQQPHWAKLVEAYTADKLPHAVLVCGDAGIGKAHYTRACAALLLCHQPVAGTACGECRACHLLNAGNHTDLLRVGLEENSRQIKIDQIRQLTAFANRTAALGLRKVIVLGPAEAMNLNAANALLKVLEEPAANTHLLLYSDSVSSLVATVRSRCQVALMSSPGAQQSLAWLTQITGDAGLSEELLAAVPGQPLRARDLFTGDGLAQQQLLATGVARLVDGQLSALEFPQLVTELDLVQALSLLLQHLQLAIKQSALAGSRPVPMHFTLLDELLVLRKAIANGANPNRQLTLETAAMQFANVLGAGES